MESLNVKHGTDAHSRTNFYEASENITARDNRKILVKTMESEGFSNYPSEWWHYDYGNRAWALRTRAGNEFYGCTESQCKGLLIPPKIRPSCETISLTINPHRLYPVTALSEPPC